jgi:geranylgeranyl pyrophosphate synthase
MINSNDQPTSNPYAAQQKMLVERLEYSLAAIPPVLRADIELSLEGEGKLLVCRHKDVSALDHQDLPAGSWSLLTLLIAQYVSPEIDHLCAGSVAVAIECFICALDLLDDLEDEDRTSVVRAIGPARVLNASTALLALAHRSILSLSQLNVPAQCVLRLLQVLQSVTLTATAGQHSDLLAEQRSVRDFTYDECIEIAEGKAGSLMSLACQLGAICAGADENMCKQFAEAGKLLGIAHQLDNDSHDLYDLIQANTITPDAALTSKSGKSDLVRKKKTLPIVLALGGSDIFQNDSRVFDLEMERNLKALQEGIIATWGICLLYRERARECLREIEAQQSFPLLLEKLLGM